MDDYDYRQQRMKYDDNILDRICVANAKKYRGKCRYLKEILYLSGNIIDFILQ
jgi:hypothetical protein